MRKGEKSRLKETIMGANSYGDGSEMQCVCGGIRNRLEQGKCIHCNKMKVKLYEYKSEPAGKYGSRRMKFSSDFLSRFR